MGKKLIIMKNITKRFGDNLVLDDFNLYINENEFITLLGPSGCGKTTCLRILGGFETADEGTVEFDSKIINNLEPNQREINTCFQKYALFPHLNVFDNIAFGLKIKKLDKATIHTRVMDILKMVKLTGFEHRAISTLSGGQQQRVAIARALINRPKVLLLDEPLAALDLKLRQEMQYELKEMQRELGITFVYVTHDQEEALTMSDTIVVMDHGKILQIGTPEDIYNEPNSRFVANFIGESNIIPGKMKEDYLVEFFNKEFECVDKGFKKDEAVDVIIRPEDIDFVPPSKAKIVGTVDSLIFRGVHYEINVMIEGKEITIHTTKYRKIGDKVGLSVEPNNIHIIKHIKTCVD
ncbi:MAG: spermidine/putrescine ABC transporter ATP-binding protein [Tenericutes bacterium HGW-Tenericutes-1]|nr:MAG: spermidine/putrescine ABC transporter ATP-binding protein [Tenericutes bacterium HGW-Tenericutes-1]